MKGSRDVAETLAPGSLTGAVLALSSLERAALCALHRAPTPSKPCFARGGSWRRCFRESVKGTSFASPSASAANSMARESRAPRCRGGPLQRAHLCASRGSLRQRCRRHTHSHFAHHPSAHGCGHRRRLLASSCWSICATLLRSQFNLSLVLFLRFVMLDPLYRAPR